MNPWIFVAAIVLVVGSYFLGGAAGSRHTTAQYEAKIAVMQKEAQAAQTTAVKAKADEGERRVKDQTAIATAATQRADELQSRNDAARADADGLRRKVAELVARASAGRANPPATAGSPPTPDPDVLLAGLLDKSLRRNQELAGYADKTHNAGAACEGSYDALTTSGARVPVSAPLTQPTPPTPPQ